ncbi:hypothetical protein AAZX31_09G025600 [Glycine max]|uniref:Homeodomain/HOMEOBOX transcription factor n=1 Tax=Glycine max TaxID=3847 RepID=I1L0G6_SOYBN|nr:homeobox-leucine zipper protein HDG11 [Glycine max]KAG4387731.1 hypothetical protein GLYMA_09G025800v4 [Glycine max]KAH1041196.1 hypothetical protein GYH30_023829 [Glycine max]KAH1041197.1 hypothetical protein GYH30_023829 [Glycine max]KRH36826.1 hypothetical protein GLYMA_09G025800v4 [Glycine max]|eukprot:XP_006586851.1 homeobox-leucine zipper protein HDG11 isoform X2 [Glycine max]
MDFAMGAAGGSGDDQHNQSLNKGKKTTTYRRHKEDQRTRLEELFRKCPNPDEIERRQIAKDLGLEPKQVKFWFQNKRTQKKTISERVDNNVLRVENERMHNENLVLREALKTIICPSCGGPHNEEERRELCLEQLRLENARLKAQHEKLSKFLVQHMDKPILEQNLDSPIRGSSSHGPLLGSSLRLRAGRSRMNLGASTSHDSFQDEEDTMSSQAGSKIITQMEKTMMAHIAVAAKDELLKLLRTNEPLWVKSSTDQRYVLHLECYETIFPRINHFKNSKARVESSKDSRIVRIKAKELVDMLLNSEIWENLFSRIVTKARTIQVLENGSLENRSGVLLLMREEMHVLSPLVPSREFYFLRYCHQVEANVWVIADVSVDCMKENNHDPNCWRFPSGCMIQGISNGMCQVSWVEHVEVDEKIQTHHLFKDLVNRNIAYGAERWLLELQRMCERFTSLEVEYIPNYDIGGVITTLGGRMSMMKFSHQMVKSFYGILNMSSITDFPQHLADENTGIRICARKVTNSNQSNPNIIITATTSFRLPLPSQNVFDFFRDPIRRVKWDAMCYKRPLHEIARISTGTHPNNYISIIQPIHPTANNVVIIQESCTDPLGSYVVYSSTNILDIKRTINGEDSSTMPFFPSGIVISEEGQSITNARASSSGNGDVRTRGSLLTVAFQILMNSSPTMMMEFVTVVNSLITSTVENINDALISSFN